MDEVEAVVIGAGVVGLAVARELAMAGREVVVLEAAEAIGTGTSSRNSEVIHAGIYYPEGSLKAALCVLGREALYRYCGERGVPTRRCGKLIVATSAREEPGLDRLARQALGNGVGELTPLSGREAMQLEPALRCTAALLSPSTGIVDSHALMLALLGDAEAGGATLALRSPVMGGRVAADGIELEVGGAEGMRLRSRIVVNCAGLHAQSVARSIEGFPLARVPSSYLCKGNYFVLAGRSPFSRLVYPMPERAGLGVHLTIDLGGQARFGPDVEWIDAIDYSVDPGRAAAFYGAIRTYWPELADGALAPGYAGIRPKLGPPGGPAQDFRIDGPAQHGVPGLVHLFGIESPGLTSCLAIASHVGAALA